MLSISENPITCPPKRKVAVSNDKRVRVEGSKKQCAIIFPVKYFLGRFSLIFLEKFKILFTCLKKDHELI